ncbi:phosphate acyltransferase [Paracoccus tegillarcae]|uniref:Phosphate butyryltransferase n=1 Tax=Paracoccus tegillarcae TaxID=1529068 RepID=A0A2K9EGU0_9RHOB|nr:phosphate acyltransferase [Paracoccus tegillarcae]AUH34190.1 phosphate butyryltransferase [Paracoccus tegillarcae]
MLIKSFAALESAMSERAPLRVVVAGAGDSRVLDALAAAAQDNLIGAAILVGDGVEIKRLLPGSLTDIADIINAPEADACAVMAVAVVRQGRADVLVKGSVNSAAYLRAVVNKETGLRKSGPLSNLTLAEMPSLDRLIGATDNGIILAPTLEQKRAILRNTQALFLGLGISHPRVAAIAASEKVSERQPATTDAAALSAEARQGDFGTMSIEGPFGYDVALSKAAAEAKGITDSAVAGRADLILFPNIEAGNATVKAWKLHGQARTASVVLGASVPVLLNSRSDAVEQRRLGLVLAQAIIAGLALQDGD